MLNMWRERHVRALRHQRLPPETYREFYGYPEQPNFPPRYNVAPTQPVPIVLEDRGERHFMLVRWGFLPSWVKDPKDFPLVINARGETLQTKPTFKAALKRRRCIFLADGFYEWQRHGREKTPFLIRPRNRGPMPLAGLWETYSSPDGGEIDTAAIVTTDANGTLSAVHDRMPVILSTDDIARLARRARRARRRDAPRAPLSRRLARHGSGLEPREQGRERRCRVCWSH